jgi:demethylmenaquinone methyltransferase/2-methoxy-6-polyprenyl-1,4-benzoquinol methylase
MTDRPSDPIVTEQIAYYDARAPEYDEWIDRRGHYDRGPEANANWHRELADVRQRLVAANLTGDILEFAPGTGNWTKVVARSATTLTAIDASAAMIAENRARLTRLGLIDNVTYIQADLFTWQPDRQYDAIVIGFFLSHVPDDLLDPILATISTAIKPGGRLFLVDSRHTQTSSRPNSPYSDLDNPLTVRHINDGRTFTIYKLFRDPANLEDAFARHSIAFTGEETSEYFVFGFGEKGTR